MKWGNWIIGACCALFVTVAIIPTGMYGRGWDILSGPDAAAWVQAIGSVAAIVAGFLIVNRSATEARKLSIEEFDRTNRERAEMEVEALFIALVELHAHTDRFCSKTTDQSWIGPDIEKFRRDVIGVTGFLDKLNLAAFPSRQIAVTVVSARSVCTALLVHLDLLEQLLQHGRQPSVGTGSHLQAGALELLERVAKVAPSLR